MRFTQRFAFVALVAVFVVPGIKAQEPAATPESGPAQSASQNAYPDIDSLREPGSSAKLFPPPSASPAPVVQGQSRNTGTGRRSNGLLNHPQHRRNARANDLIGDQADGDPLEIRVAYRRAKTTAMARDPGLAELLREAAGAGTDVQKRAILKEYYTRLFAEVRKVDRSPEMRKHVELLSQVSQQRWDPQRRTVGGEEDIVRGGGGGRRGRAR